MRARWVCVAECILSANPRAGPLKFAALDAAWDGRGLRSVDGRLWRADIAAVSSERARERERGARRTGILVDFREEKKTEGRGGSPPLDTPSAART